MKASEGSMQGRRVARPTLIVVSMSIGCVASPPELPEVQPTTSDASSTSTTVTHSSTSSTASDVTTAEVTTTTGALETSTGLSAECGNGIVEDGEECDGDVPRALTCTELGLDPGLLGCTEACRIDVTGCVPPGMVLVPAGAFIMGSNEVPEEQPIRQVHLDAFWIDATEVTTAKYTECVVDGVCESTQSGEYYNYMVDGKENHPINGVRWQDADEYCKWVSGGIGRLPTEAEWEKAARGTDARIYPWGDVPEPSCVYVVMEELGDVNGCGTNSTGEVGSKPPGISPYGALDMSGNVFELVSDWYGPYSVDAMDNPTGPDEGTMRVMRGAAWNITDPGQFQASHRYEIAEEYDAYDVGFRCAQSPPVETSVGS